MPSVWARRPANAPTAGVSHGRTMTPTLVTTNTTATDAAPTVSQLPRSHRRPTLTVNEDVEYFTLPDRRLTRTERNPDADIAAPDLDPAAFDPAAVKIGYSARVRFAERHRTSQDQAVDELRGVLARAAGDFARHYRRLPDGFHQFTHQGVTVTLTPDGQVLTRYQTRHGELPSVVAASRPRRGPALPMDLLRQLADPAAVAVAGTAAAACARRLGCDRHDPRVADTLHAELADAWHHGTWNAVTDADGSLRTDRYLISTRRALFIVAADNATIIGYRPRRSILRRLTSRLHIG